MPEPETADDERFAIVVVRSGGIAGLSKQWRAEPDAERAPRWRELVERCPWDAPTPETTGADRYQWRIEVHRGDTALHEARLGDTQVQGPWRTLVDEVRRSSAPTPRAR